MAEDRRRLESWWVRVPVGIFFLASGLWLVVVVSLGGPSFWYYPCAVLWTVCGVAWLVRPSVAVGFSAAPILGMAILVGWVVTPIGRRQSAFDPWTVVTLAAWACALVIVLAALRDRRTWKAWTFTVSLALVLLSFAVDRLFTNKVEVRTLTMQWSANGHVPWGDVEPGQHGEIPVVLYLKVKGGYCEDALFSPELKALLIHEGRPTVTVEYNLFRDFGTERGYNIRSVDGMIFSLGERTVRRSQDGYGGTELDDGALDASCPR